MNGLIMFHQGWTDIVNCLSIINFYSEKYQNITLAIRDDSKDLIDFYCKNIPNVNVKYYPKYKLDNSLNEVIDENPNNELLFIGLHDVYRNDEFKDKFRTSNSSSCFVEKFYIDSGIEYINRINLFNINRDVELENNVFNKFIEVNGPDYILYHEDSSRDIKIDKTNFNTNFKHIDLNGVSSVFFDYIKILENAKEIHLIDSVWASIIYHIDCKYKLFSHIPIHLHCLRDYQTMFIKPIKLDNWVIT